MTPRERFIQNLTFGEVDRVYYCFGQPRGSTMEAWYLQGLPKMPDAGDYGCPPEFMDFVGMDPSPWRGGIPVNQGPFPAFDVEVIAEDEGGLTWRDSLGIVMHDAGRSLGTPGFKTRSYVSHPVSGWDDWPVMRDRFDPGSEGRYPDDWHETTQKHKKHTYPIMMTITGFFWRCRDWVGFENLCTMFYDNPRLVDEMMECNTQFLLGVLERGLSDVEVDCVIINEDMAYKHASMISPAMVREFMLPRYKRLVSFLRGKGVPVILLDCDGHISDLIPIWIEAGMDGTFPCEIASLNDPLAYRQMYGKKLSFFGCLDKREIATKERTYQEVMGKMPALLELGGFLPSVDHAVPPTVPLRSYLYMCHIIKALAEGSSIPGPDDPLPLEEGLGPIERMWGPDLLTKESEFDDLDS